MRIKVTRLSRADTQSTEERMQRLETDRLRSQTRKSTAKSERAERERERERLRERERERERDVSSAVFH